MFIEKLYPLVKYALTDEASEAFGARDNCSSARGAQLNEVSSVLAGCLGHISTFVAVCRGSTRCCPGMCSWPAGDRPDCVAA